ncbi:MAG: RNA polymerase sporulation sigma factor SigK [Oscillospiraceae bacterium]|nr:RNA polymerase sporulation sigma factor SigK [Oscillospiraceae bacterium]
MSFSLALLLACPLLTLRLSGNAGVFPKPLSPEEEKLYLARYAAGDMEARGVLIERNLRLIAHIIKKYYVQASDADDLISIGTIGLIKGISTYKPDKGVKLATYASRCIENEILMHFRRLKKTGGEVSLSDAIDSDGEGTGLSLMDVLSDDADMFEDVSAQETCGRVRELVASVLTEREREILTLRYGLDGGLPKTQRETAQRCGISRSYVSRIEKKALEKLRTELESE